MYEVKTFLFNDLRAVGTKILSAAGRSATHRDNRYWDELLTTNHAAPTPQRSASYRKTIFECQGWS